jgi:hypothetical protein
LLSKYKFRESLGNRVRDTIADLVEDIFVERDLAEREKGKGIEGSSCIWLKSLEGSATMVRGVGFEPLTLMLLTALDSFEASWLRTSTGEFFISFSFLLVIPTTK